MPHDHAASGAPLYSVRLASRDEAALVAALGARLFEQAFGAANRPDDVRAHVAASFGIDTIAATLADPLHECWIAEDIAGVAIGYALLHRGSIAQGLIADRPMEVQRFYVDQEWYGRGVADALMLTCVGRARAWQCDLIWLGVWERNPRAIAFYGKKGFRTVGTQAFTVGTDEQRDFVMLLSPFDAAVRSTDRGERK